MRIHTRHLTIATLCGLLLASPAFAQLTLPSNLHVASIYRELVESMADQSPTFQAQLLRIATAAGVTVHVEVVPHIVGARAMTRMVRQHDALTARIEVARFDDLVELIAHEIEHVIEQIDAIDLAADAGQPGTGVHSVDRDRLMFETARAARVGLSVAEEVRESIRRGN